MLINTLVDNIADLAFCTNDVATPGVADNLASINVAKDVNNAINELAFQYMGYNIVKLIISQLELV